MRVEHDQVKTLVILLALTVFFGLGLWLPLNAKQKSTRAEVDELDRKIHSDRQTTVGLTALGQKIVQLEQTLDSADKRIPQETELASLLRQLSGELKRYEVTDLEIQTQAIQQGDDYSLVPISLKFRGSFRALFSFLRYVETTDRLIRMNRLEADGNPDRSEEPLIVQIELSTFYKPNMGSDG